MQINRLFEIVYLLMNKKIVTANEFAKHFEVSQRTIYRDIETLCQAGIPIYTNKGKGGGICLMDQFVLNKSLLSVQEQTDILTALQSFKAANFSDTDQVLTKLNSVFGHNNPDWIEVDFTNWSSKAEDKDKFQQLKQAILQNQMIQFQYYNSNGQESSRLLEPRKLLFKGQAWYLYGYCLDKKAYRYFKISRIKGLILTTETFTPLPIEESVEETSDKKYQQLTEVTIKLDASMAYRVYDEFPSEEITQQEDGSFLIHTKLYAGGWIYGYMMSFEDQLELLEPEWLRNNLIDRYKNVLRKYNMTH